MRSWSLSSACCFARRSSLRAHLAGHYFDLLGDRVAAPLRGEAIQLVQRDEVAQPLDRVPGPELDELVEYGRDHEAL
jgi:hypothetical protein